MEGSVPLVGARASPAAGERDGTATVPAGFARAVLCPVGARRDPCTSELGPWRSSHHGSRGGPSPPMSRAWREAEVCGRELSQPQRCRGSLRSWGRTRSTWTGQRAGSRWVLEWMMLFGMKTGLKGKFTNWRRETGRQASRGAWDAAVRSGAVSPRRWPLCHVHTGAWTRVPSECLWQACR